MTTHFILLNWMSQSDTGGKVLLTCGEGVRGEELHSMVREYQLLAQSSMTTTLLGVEVATTVRVIMRV